MSQASPSSFPQYFPFEFGENCKQSSHRSTSRRGQIQRLGQGNERHTQLLQFLKGRQQIRYRAAPAFEQLSAERFKAVIDTNFYSDVNVTRAAVPHMRKQRSGCILQISSVGGRLTRPGSTPYHAAKWAVGGFTESLAQELSPFGVKVCALEPGGMRTNWGARANQDTPELLPDYEPSVGAVAKALKSYWGKEVSDPVKVAQVVLRLAASDSLPAHLLIGSDAVRFAGEAEKTREAEAAQWRQMSLSTDVDSSTVLPDMRF
jgi:NAD(P)-dependent dehydrogenase (short-subunit alcohol dehydrogenase family)